jgi:hypothetical protein
MFINCAVVKKAMNETTSKVAITPEGLLTLVGTHFRDEKIISENMERYRARDFHMFYFPTQDNSKVIHIQAYSHSADEFGVEIMARILDADTMYAERSNGASKGNEHKAFISNLFEQSPYRVSYDADALVNLLANNCELLRKPKPLKRR